MAAEPGDMEADDAQRPKWNWWLVVIPILAVTVFVVALLYGAGTLDPADIAASVELIHIVIAGCVVFVALAIVEIALLVGREPENLKDVEEPAPAPAVSAARADQTPDLEAIATDDELQGKQVIEVARPPKWAVEAGIYATTYVDVDRAHVLRLEEVVAVRP